MLIEYLVSAVILGIIVAIPPGSVTVIACQRALQYGFRNSIFFSLGSCFADIFYLTLVYIGIANIITDNRYLKIGLWFVCGIILIILGIASILSIRKKNEIEIDKSDLNLHPLPTFISGILVTLSNPMTIVGWIVVAGNFYLIWNEKYPDARHYNILTISLIIVGVLLWFIPLTYIVSRLRKKMNARLKKWLIIVSNLCLIAFGFFAFYFAIKAMINLK